MFPVVDWKSEVVSHPAMRQNAEIWYKQATAHTKKEVLKVIVQPKNEEEPCDGMSSRDAYSVAIVDNLCMNCSISDGMKQRLSDTCRVQIRELYMYFWKN